VIPNFEYNHTKTFSIFRLEAEDKVTWLFSTFPIKILAKASFLPLASLEFILGMVAGMGRDRADALFLFYSLISYVEQKNQPEHSDRLN